MLAVREVYLSHFLGLQSRAVWPHCLRCGEVCMKVRVPAYMGAARTERRREEGKEGGLCLGK